VKIEYTAEAVGDLDHISQHYAERAGTEVAQRLVRRTRSFPVLPYVIFYRTAGKRIVQRVLHGHRDIHPPLVSLLLAV
jgi:plasmid stabilization system protein ParE